MLTNNSDFIEKYCGIIFSYKTVGMSNLHFYYFRESEIKTLSKIVSSELVILQTCNRVEIYLYSEKAKDLVNNLIEYLNKVHNKPIGNEGLVLCGREVIKHLFQVASGIDSISIGEYEILSQLKSTIEMFEKLGISGKYLRILFERAIKVGREVREKTKISKGKVGIYSLAVEESKKRIGNLDGKKVGVIGAGEMGKKIVRILYNERVNDVTILNRTLEKAKTLASKYGYKYDNFALDKVFNFDAVFVAIENNFGNKIVQNNSNTLIVDISVPPLFYGNNVITIEDLEKASHENLKMREEEINKINEIINERVNQFIYDYKKEIYSEFISKIMRRVEDIRRTEVNRAYKELQNIGINNEEVLEILNLMTNSMLKKVFQPLFDNVRTIIFNDEESINYINFLIDIFKDGNFSGDKTKKTEEKQVNKGPSSGNSA